MDVNINGVCSIVKVLVRGWLQRLDGSYPGFDLRKFPLLRQYVTRHILSQRATI